MVFQYKINYPVADTSDVIFKVVFPDPGKVILKSVS